MIAEAEVRAGHRAHRGRPTDAISSVAVGTGVDEDVVAVPPSPDEQPTSVAVRRRGSAR